MRVKYNAFTVKNGKNTDKTIITSHPSDSEFKNFISEEKE